MIRCLNCNYENDDGTKFCTNCGSRLDGSQIETVEGTAVNNTQTPPVNVVPTPVYNTQPIAVANKASKGLDVFSLIGFIGSFLSLVTFGIFSVPSLVLSIIGIIRTKKYGKRGKGMAIAGTVISGIGLIIFMIWALPGKNSNTKTTETTTIAASVETTDETTTKDTTTGRSNSNNDTQKFYVTPVGDNQFLLQSASNPDLVIAPPSGDKHAKLEIQNYVKGSNLQLWTFNPNPNPNPKPTVAPTATATPTVEPTKAPTATPTAKPTKAAGPSPTNKPKPTQKPTKTPVVSLTIDKTDTTAISGKTTQLKATLTGSNAKITWKSSNADVATVDSTGNVTAKMAGPVLISATAAGKNVSCKVQVLYKDVTNSKSFWYAPTNYLTNNGVVKGYNKQTMFKPSNKCTRAQMVTFIWRLEGSPEPDNLKCKFKDVKKSDYFYKACIWGNEQGIVEGYKDGTFGPKIVCARRHAVTFLWRLAGKPDPKSALNKFKDVKKKDYFYLATLWASEKNILAGYDDGTFRPNGDCLRRQMVTFLYKYDKFVNGKG